MYTLPDDCIGSHRRTHEYGVRKRARARERENATGDRQKDSEKLIKKERSLGKIFVFETTHNSNTSYFHLEPAHIYINL